MDFEKILNSGVEKNIINESQKAALINLYKQNGNEPENISVVVRVFYYIGWFIMLAAMTALMSHTIQHSTYTVILILCAVYALLFFGVGEYLWRKNEKFPAGILYFLFIAAFGLIVMDIEKMTGFFPHFSDMDETPHYWSLCRLPIFTLSTLTIIANTFLQKFRQASLLALPTIFCSYAIYMIFADFVYGWQVHKSSLIFGVGLIVVAFIKDRLTKADYSKWMYLLGSTLTFICIIAILCEYDLEIYQIQFTSFVIGLIYILAGLLIQRKPFSITGILSVVEYFIYLEIKYIKDNITLLTSVILITGLLVLYAGVIYTRNADKLQKYIELKLPKNIRKYLPQNRV